MWRSRTKRKRGRILAIKWGLNPNSSSLGVDVTFLLFGAAALAFATPIIAALVRMRRPAGDPHLVDENTETNSDSNPAD